MKRLITLSLLYCPIWLSAQGYQVQVQGQKQQAMGNAGSGFAQDAATVFYNPGGMGFVKNSVSAGGNAAIINSVFRDSLTYKVFDSKIPVSTPFTFYATYGTDSSKSTFLKKLKFGLGVYTPFGGAAKYPDGWVGRFVLNSLDLKVLSIQPTLSYKINNKIGIGAGFAYNVGAIEFSKDVYLSDSSANFATAHVKSKLSGYGVNAGIYIKPTEEFSIGLTFRSQVKMKSSGGTADFKVPSNLKDSVPNGDAKMDFPLPTVISFGLGYKLTDKFSMAFDVNYIGFKVFDTLRVDFKKNTSGLADIADPRKFKNTYSFHLGGQYMATENLAVRLGMRYVVSPIPYGHNTPEGGDANHLVLCGGLGYNIGTHFTLDASYSFESMLRNGNDKFYNLIGTYKTYASIAGLSVAYKF
jgi:long-chain fatty acid transport protein